jgi:hypothetical protein
LPPLRTRIHHSSYSKDKPVLIHCGKVREEQTRVAPGVEKVG